MIVYKGVFCSGFVLGLFATMKRVFQGIAMDALIEELKGKLISLLNLQELTSEAFDPDARLVGGELGIDSIDVLEMVVMVEKDYGVLINNQEVGQEVFASLRALATYIEQHSPGINS